MSCCCLEYEFPRSSCLSNMEASVAIGGTTRAPAICDRVNSAIWQTQQTDQIKYLRLAYTGISLKLDSWNYLVYKENKEAEQGCDNWPPWCVGRHLPCTVLPQPVDSSSLSLTPGGPPKCLFEPLPSSPAFRYEPGQNKYWHHTYKNDKSTLIYKCTHIFWWQLTVCVC